MKKRIIIIAIIVVAVLGIFGFLSYSYIAETRIKKEIKQSALEASNKWANFSDSNSEAYLASLKPFLTEEKYKALSKDAIKAQDINSKYGVIPTGSTFTGIEIKSISKEKGKYIVRAEGSHKYTIDQEPSVKIAEIIFVRSNNDWLISDIYFEN
jgi:hypothetical protein